VIDPHVEPMEFSADVDGQIVVVVHQIVRNLQQNVLEISVSCTATPSQTG
jgi:hypothetical protein